MARPGAPAEHGQQAQGERQEEAGQDVHRHPDRVRGLLAPVPQLLYLHLSQHSKDNNPRIDNFLNHLLSAVSDGLQVHAARVPGLLLAGHGQLGPQSPDIFQHECKVSVFSDELLSC